MRAVIGIDPGTSGGVALMCDRALWACYYVEGAKEQTVTETAYMVGTWLSTTTVSEIVIAYESNKVHRQPGDPTKGALLAGRMLQALERELRERRLPKPVVVPVTSDTWRKDLWGFCRIEGNRKAWKALAIKYCDRHHPDWRRLSEVRAQAKLEDVAEGVCIAESVFGGAQ